jgi:hypothetical protein
MKRSLFFAIATTVIVAGFGAVDARAGQLTLADLLVPGATIVVPPEPDTFSNFTYSTSPAGSAPSAADINVNEFHFGAENGITFAGPFQAAPMGVVDYQISYVVTAPAGSSFTDAFLSATFNRPPGTTGTVSIGESLTYTGGSQQLQISQSSGPDTVSIPAGVSSILVQKDILINGGSLGAGVSFVNQGFSSSTVPEPASLALLGIGMTGFLAFRRFFKKTSVA